MKFLEATTRHNLNLQWLSSEWWKLAPHLPSGSRLLIDNPDLHDPKQNEARARILRACRGPIVDPIPGDARYRHVRIEEDDLPKLFVLTCWDWYLDTGRTFALTNTPTHLKRPRGGVINGRRESVDHVQTVTEKIPYIQDHNPNVSDEPLILVATEEIGPYTIIDGTHRAAALLTEHQRRPNMPWNAILIDSPRMTENRWHIGFAGVSQILDGLGNLADQGHIW